MFVGVMIHVHPSRDIVECHAICDEIEKMMSEKHHVSHVHIHIEPDKKLLIS
ncbi:cation transporter dimerization domain-containing protein [Ammoniphilus sp. YIM 78166]|uniref:cation transporter dimerization domain-containing protein n=1 Tax=Ammoniphilus sp. YIM 78166 TaxID=1644106 RepID=UPI003515F4F1